MSEGARGVVVAHASLGAGLVAAARQISGAEEGVLTAVSNDGTGPETLLARLREIAGDGPVVVFTDLPSGSCALAARKLLACEPNTALVCGANLAVLLDFVFHRTLPLPELVDRLVDKARSGVVGAVGSDGS